ncbi:MAG: ATP-binding protein [Roseococcus sp.]|nr:ATP-binding protein [Roseococcus sp.]
MLLVAEDDGPGIPAEDLPRLLDAFFRAAHTDRIAVSSGLGLSICRGLVRAMGSSIAAESPITAGRGTRISLRFLSERRNRRSPSYAPSLSSGPASTKPFEPSAAC